MIAGCARDGSQMQALASTGSRAADTTGPCTLPHSARFALALSTFRGIVDGNSEFRARRARRARGAKIHLFIRFFNSRCTETRKLPCKYSKISLFYHLTSTTSR